LTCSTPTLRIVAIALIALGVGCGEETWPTHVACVGDSITFGDGASSPSETYPAALQGMLGTRTLVHGFGHSGATALGPGASRLAYESQPEYAAATRFVGEAGEGARVAVIVLLGANDSKAAVWDASGRSDRFRADYARLVDHFAGLRTHPTVYLATPLGVGAHPCCGIRGDVLTRDITPIVAHLASERGLPTIDLGDVVTGHPELLVDGVHPNDRGYEALATKVREALASHPPSPARRTTRERSWLGRLGFSQ
jgi:lysophospholipase L1-like esterase